MNEELSRQNDQMRGELSLVSNQKKLLDTMREEINQMRSQQRKFTEHTLEQEMLIEQKGALLEKVRKNQSTESHEYHMIYPGKPVLRLRWQQ